MPKYVCHLPGVVDMRRRHLFSLVFAPLLAMTTSGMTLAATIADDVSGVTDDLIMKEIALLRLNASLKLNSLPHSRWGARRWALVGMTNNTLTSVGAFATAAGRFRYINKPKKAPVNFFERAAICRVIANAITASGATIELAADGISVWKEHKNGTDLGTTRRYANSLIAEIDQLLAQREAGVSRMAIDSPDRIFLTKQGDVLQDMRDLGCNEFARFYAEAKGNRITRDLNYTISLLSNLESGAGSFYGSVRAPLLRRVNSRTRTRMGGVAGITDIVSGSLNIAAPLISRGGGALVRVISRDKLSRELDLKQIDNLDAVQHHKEQFEASVKQQPALNVHAELLRAKAFDAQIDILQQHEKLRHSEERAARHRLVENMVNSGVSGGTKIANGVGAAVGAFQYTAKPHERFGWSGSTAVAYGAGNAFSGAETLRNLLWNEIHANRAKDQGTSTKQVLQKQLADLETIESEIHKGSPSGKFAASPNQITK
jgi:hypothetical protein